MYRFVKIHFKLLPGTEEKDYWYFVPNSIEQVQEHFTKIFGREISAGVKDRLGPYKHPQTPWRLGVDLRNRFSGNNWLVDAVTLENEVLQNRIRDFFNFGEIYLADGVQQLGFDNRFHEIIEEIESETLSYPMKMKYRVEDVQYMQWNIPGFPKGEHWYAKIGNIDIYDEKGNMKWNTKLEAFKAAEWFCQKLNQETYFES